MESPLSSEQAEEQSNGDYETLEEYIIETERDRDNEIGKAMRFRDWQEMQLRIIKDRIGTNAVEVVARSYLMGLKRIRSDHHEEIEGMSEMLTEFLIAIGNSEGNDRTYLRTAKDIEEFEVEDPNVTGQSVNEPRRYKIQESAVSEVERFYIQDAFFGPWVHRYVAALGFLDSQFVTQKTEDYLSSTASAVSNSMDEAREEMESMIMDYISMSQSAWIEDGLRERTHDHLREAVTRMETSRRETCMALLERSEDFIRDKSIDNDSKSHNNGESND